MSIGQALSATRERFLDEDKASVRKLSNLHEAAEFCRHLTIAACAQFLEDVERAIGRQDKAS